MNKTELVAVLAETMGLSREQANDILTITLDEITLALSRDQSVSLPGFGSFTQRHRAARSGRSPKTGETIQIAASNSVGFKPGKALKDAVNQ